MMSPSSQRATLDAATHLNQQLTEVLLRHARIMEAGGMSTAEAAAAVMMATEQLAFTAIGLVTLQAPPRGRQVEVRRTIARLTSHLHDRIASILTEIGKVGRPHHG